MSVRVLHTLGCPQMERIVSGLLRKPVIGCFGHFSSKYWRNPLKTFCRSFYWCIIACVCTCVCVCVCVCVHKQMCLCGADLRNDEGCVSGPLESVSVSVLEPEIHGRWSGREEDEDPARTDGRSVRVLLPLTLVTGLPAATGALLHGAETHTWPLGLLYTNGVIQQISDSVHVPQSGCCLPASLQKLPS